MLARPWPPPSLPYALGCSSTVVSVSPVMLEGSLEEHTLSLCQETEPINHLSTQRGRGKGERPAAVQSALTTPLKKAGNQREQGTPPRAHSSLSS